MAKHLGRINQELDEQNQIIDIVSARAKIEIRKELKLARKEIIKSIKTNDLINTNIILNHQARLEEIFKKHASRAIEAEYARQLANLKRYFQKSIIIAMIKKQAIESDEVMFKKVEEQAEDEKNNYLLLIWFEDTAKAVATTTAKTIETDLAKAKEMINIDLTAQGITNLSEQEKQDMAFDLVDEGIDATEEARSTLIAETQTHSDVTWANETITKIGTIILGVVTKKEWVSKFDAKTRQAHREAHGQVVGMQERFNVGGEMLSRPGDPAGSPGNIINCRCVLGYQLI
jgi:uncharacterized protein with gpF-like domain